MTRILSRLLAIVTLCAVSVVPAMGYDNNPDDLDAHGNNPRHHWAGVSFAGIDVAMPYDWYWLLQQAGGNISPASDCVETLQAACPEGICCICVYGNHCSGSCRDANGDCQPCPECNGDAHAWMP